MQAPKPTKTLAQLKAQSQPSSPPGRPLMRALLAQP